MAIHFDAKMFSIRTIFIDENEKWFVFVCLFVIMNELVRLAMMMHFTKQKTKLLHIQRKFIEFLFLYFTFNQSTAIAVVPKKKTCITTVSDVVKCVMENT